ncbi:hypothetical protein MSTE_03576 [Mycobacteroides stephanolepidis]|uniref:Uncharacterized protein n=1 Tax=[Mycobacterium] stephanolepidis TaxID=1520670 RepID=A0A1Z4F0Y6_9MYCO|nr:hypothetical protein MSTE_03576 [[Mycobacterium] stephanolepidis]
MSDIVYFNDLCTCEHEFCEHEECGNSGTLLPTCYGRYHNGTRCLCEKFTSAKEN